ncbi:MAG: hypothetical protein ACK5MU_04230 [Candidatus Saccharimonadales bacterium]
MTTKDYYHQKALLELEQKIRERCINRVVRNDGTELAQLLEEVCTASEVTHAGNFVFSAKHYRSDRILIFTEPMCGGEEHIRIIGYSIEPKKDTGIVPVLKDADIGEADEALIDFAKTIDFRGLYKQIRASALIVAEFEIPQIAIRREKIHIEFASKNVASQTGPFSAILKHCYIHSFSNSVFRDKETDAPKYWVSVHIRYEHKDGGENGMDIGTALYCDGAWEFTGALVPQENPKNSLLPSSLF